MIILGTLYDSSVLSLALKTLSDLEISLTFTFKISTDSESTALTKASQVSCSLSSRVIISVLYRLLS